MTTYIGITYIGIALFVAALLYAISTGMTGNIIASFQTKKSAKIQQSFFETVFTLLGYVARKDGPVNQQEIKRTEKYMETMELKAPQKREAIRFFKTGSSPTFNFKKTIDEFKWLSKKSPNLTQILLVYLVNLARADGLLVTQEVEAVRGIAKELGQSNITFDHLLKMISSQDKFHDEPLKEQKSKQSYESKNTYDKKYGNFSSQNERSDCAYDALGLTPSASDADVKKAYRSLVNQLHPDKLIGRGIPSFMVDALSERFKYVQSAYDCIKESRDGL